MLDVELSFVDEGEVQPSNLFEFFNIFEVLTFEERPTKRKRRLGMQAQNLFDCSVGISRFSIMSVYY